MFYLEWGLQGERPFVELKVPGIHGAQTVSFPMVAGGHKGRVTPRVRSILVCAMKEDTDVLVDYLVLT